MDEARTGSPGWYLDPGREPGRYRFWNGREWSSQTAPAAQPTRTPPLKPRSRRPRAVVLAALLILALLTLAGDRPVADRDPRPAPSTTPSDQPSPLANLAPCAAGQPSRRAPHPRDGRVHGGNLSFSRAPGFEPESPEPRLRFASDVVQQVRTVSLGTGWIAQLAVGRLRSADGYPTDPRLTADTVVHCLVGSSLYVGYSDHRVDLRSVPHAVDGRSGWLIEADILVSVPGLSFPGDRVIVVVVPDGTDWGVFVGAVPIGDPIQGAVLDATVADLRVD